MKIDLSEDERRHGTRPGYVFSTNGRTWGLLAWPGGEAARKGYNGEVLSGLLPRPRVKQAIKVLRIDGCINIWQETERIFYQKSDECFKVFDERRVNLGLVFFFLTEVNFF